MMLRHRKVRTSRGERRCAHSKRRLRAGHALLYAALVGAGCAAGSDDASDERDRASFGRIEEEQTSADDEGMGDGAQLSEEGGLISKGFVQAAQQGAQIYRWSKGERDVYMNPRSTHFCFLSRVSGELGGPNSAIAVHRSTADMFDVLSAGNVAMGTVVNDDGAIWKLGGIQRAANSLTGEAVCIPLSNFLIDPGMVIGQSGRFFVVANLGDTNECSRPIGISVWTGNAVTTLAGIQGNFSTTSDWIDVASGQWNTSSTLRVQSTECGRGWAEARAHSLFVGVPGQPATKRTAPVTKSGNTKTKLLQTHRGACFLTKIAGDFDGSEERIRIYPTVDSYGVEWWTLETHAGRGSARATAQCVLYWQSASNLCDRDTPTCI